MKAHSALVPVGCIFFLASAVFLCRLPDCGAVAAVVMALVLTGALALAVFSLRRLPSGLLVCCAAIGGAFLLGRLLCFGTATSDYNDFLLPWTNRLRALGGLPGLGTDIGNYNVPYMVLLALISYLPLPPLYPIKLISVLFDLLLALTLSGLAGRLSGSRIRAGVCFILALALPTVFINGAVWGQCDSIYVTFGLLGLWLCLSDRPIPGMAAFALSLSFKLQAIFILPLILPLLLMKKVRWYHLPVFPAVYVLAVSPAVIAGKGFKEVLLIYLNTASTAGTALSYNAPSVFSLYYFYRLTDTEPAAKAGILAAVLLCVLFSFLFVAGRKRITEKSVLYAALITCCGLPLLLPHMHDRYFYFCDALTLCAACLVPETAVTVLLSQFASLLGYYAYFYMKYLLPMRLGFCGLVIVFAVSLVLCLHAVFSRRGEPEAAAAESSFPESKQEEPPEDPESGSRAVPPEDPD